jgi:hypothetical protein
MSNVPASEEVDRIRTIIFSHCPLEEGVAYMPVPRCETCKHYEAYPPHARYPEDTQGSCNNENIKIVSDDQFAVRPDFGCVQWEAK